MSGHNHLFQQEHWQLFITLTSGTPGRNRNKSMLNTMNELQVIILKNLDIELTKKRRETKLITRRFEDILSSLSSDRKNSVLEFKGANIQYVNLHEQFRP